jgi:hypothetical protein
VSELRAGSCIKDPFLFFDTGVSRLGFGEEVLSSYLGSFKVYQTGFVTVELHAGIKDLRRGTVLWPVQDVYTRVRFRFAVCMICFLHVYGVVKCPKESQERIRPSQVNAMQECTEVWAVGCAKSASWGWNSLMHRGM